MQKCRHELRQIQFAKNRTLYDIKEITFLNIGLKTETTQAVRALYTKPTTTQVRNGRKKISFSLQILFSLNSFSFPC